MAAVTAAVAVGAGAAASSVASSRAANKGRRSQLRGLSRAEAAREELVEDVLAGNFRAREATDDLEAFEGFGLEDVFGTRVDEIDTLESQRRALSNAVNVQSDLDRFLRDQQFNNTDRNIARAARIDPNFSDNLGTLSNQARALLRGELPQDVLDERIRDRAQISAGTGVAGTAREATLRDLGLDSLDAINRGASLFQQANDIREQVDPISGRLNTRDFFIDPTRQIGIDDRNSQVRATFDPAANQIFGIDLQGRTQTEIAKGNVQPRQSVGLNAFGSAASGVGGFLTGGLGNGFFSSGGGGFGFGAAPSTINTRSSK